jgi:isoleucyl-tRNA synthetase
VKTRILPDNKRVGPKFGSRFPAVREALTRLDPIQTAAVLTGEGITLTLEDGSTVQLSAEEVVVQTQPAEGLAVASDRLATVAIDTTLTPALRAEGSARELVRRIQDMRKKAGFNIDDRITLYYSTGSAELAGVFEAWQGYIQSETLATRLVAGQPEEGAYCETHSIDEMPVNLGVKR